VRYETQGVLEYLGRLDEQVKVRGQRIELGEVEAVLAGHAEVDKAVVLWRESSCGEGRLEAYVTATGEDGVPGPGELRGWLAERIPGYMIPTAYEVLEVMPLTASGKVNRLALEPLNGDTGAQRRVYEAPRTDVELELAAIWCEVQGVERVGIHDDFFELGGHSLLATRLLARTEEAFGIAIPLVDFFAAPTVEGLSELVENLRWLRSMGDHRPELASERNVPHQGGVL